MKNMWAIVGGIIIVLTGYFVWPTMYQYDKLNGKFPVRINRFTGDTEILYASGWQRVNSLDSVSAAETTNNTLNATTEPSNDTKSQTNKTSPKVVAQNVSVMGDQTGYATVSGEVYNTGDGPTKLNVDINMTVYDTDGSVLGSDNTTVFGILQPGQKKSFSRLIRLSHVAKGKIDKYNINLQY